MRCSVPFSEVPRDVQIERVRDYLRQEVYGRLRELAAKEPAELACRVCGETVEVSRGHAGAVTNGRREGPLCPSCRYPERAAQEDAEVVRFVELFTDSPEELAAAIAALS